MQTSPAAIDLIKQTEQLRLSAYKPTPHDRWTIGWGSTFYEDGGPVKKGDVCTLARADQIFDFWIKKLEGQILNLVKVPLNQGQFDALVSFVYNIGISAFSSSTLRKKLNAGDYAGAADQFIRWVKQYNPQTGKHDPVLGLFPRRQKEKALFTGAKIL